MDEQQRLILRAALLPPHKAVTAWDEFRSMYSLDRASPLLSWAAGSVHENLAREGVSDRYLWGIYQHNLIKNSQVLRATESGIADLSRFTSVIRLKSFARVSDGEKLGTRPLADIDILVSRRSLRVSVDILSRHGFSPAFGVTRSEFWDRVFPQRSSWGFENSEGQSIDLHWRLFDHVSRRAERSALGRMTRRNQNGKGQISTLDPATEVVLLAIQQRVQFHTANHLLIDFWKLQARTDIAKILQTANKVNCLEWVQDCYDRLSDIFGEEESRISAFQDELGRYPNSMEPVHNHQARTSFSDRVGFARPAVRLAEPRSWVRFFLLLGKPHGRIETKLIAAFGAFSRNAVARVDANSWIFCAKDSSNVDAGWTYRFPTQGFVWARYPEGSLFFKGAGPGMYTLQVGIEREEWIRHPLGELSLFVNGVEVQKIGKTTSQIKLGVYNNVGTLEVSFRRADGLHFLTPGIFKEWYSQMLPVTSVSLIKST